MRTSVTSSTTARRPPADCAIASTVPHSASFPKPTWSAKATVLSFPCSTRRRPLNTNRFAPSLPHLLLSPPPLVLPDEGRFALSGASIKHKGEGFVRKAHNFCVKAHCFRAKVPRFSPLALAYIGTTADDWGKVHRAGENAPQTKWRDARLPTPFAQLFCPAPRFRNGRGATFFCRGYFLMQSSEGYRENR